MAVLRWRRLTPEQQRDIRRRRLPAKVARSMAFEGEPVDLRHLEEALKGPVRGQDSAPETRGAAGHPRTHASCPTARHGAAAESQLERGKRR